MAMGVLCVPPAMIFPCKTQCYVCDRSYKAYFLPSVMGGAIEFLDSRRFTGNMPFMLTVANYDEFIDRLVKDKDSLKKVSGLQSITRYNVIIFSFSVLQLRSFRLNYLLVRMLGQWYLKTRIAQKNSKIYCGGKAYNLGQIGMAVEQFLSTRLLLS